MYLTDSERRAISMQEAQERAAMELNALEETTTAEGGDEPSTPAE